MAMHGDAGGHTGGSPALCTGIASASTCLTARLHGASHAGGASSCAGIAHLLCGCECVNVNANGNNLPATSDRK